MPRHTQPKQVQHAATDVAIVIPPEGPTQDLSFAGASPSLKELQAAVGGYIEAVPINGVSRTVLIVNEEGLIHRLPENPRASQIAGRLIVGTAILLPRKLLD
jgi:hypothetical protein